MTLTIQRSETLVIMQASGTPEELAAFVELAGLTEVPVLVDCDDDELTHLDMSEAVVQ